MKLIHFIVGIGAGAACSIIGIRLDLLPSSLTAHEPSQAAFERILTSHQARLSRYHSGESIHFFGASTIQALDVQDLSPNALNFGIGGETTAGLKLRLPIYPSLQTAPAVFIQSGYNDKGKVSYEETEANFTSIFSVIPAKAEIYLITFQPARDRSSGAIDPHVLSLNRLLRDVCAKEKRCTLLDLFGLLSETKEPILERDLIHLNAAGYEILTELVNQTIQQFGRQERKSETDL